MKKPLTRLDLNLLFTLQLLIHERSVTKAAKRLNVTPSTVSKSLNKLRDWFDDPLFTKTPSGLEPTQLVLSMDQELADWLQMSSQLLDRRSDNVAKGIHFHLIIESPLVLTLLGKLIPKIHQHYPEAKIKASNWDYDSLNAIIQGDADIGFTGRESHPRSKESLNLLPYFIDHEVLFSEPPVVYFRDDHPALEEEWNLDTFLKYSHINIMWEKSETWALDEVMIEIERERHIGLTLPSFEQSLFMAAQPHHTMLATAPKYCQHYTKQAHPNLISLPIPLDEEQLNKLVVPFTLIWHKRNAHSPKIRLLRDVISALCQ
jgi:DNA-binding transcriptional LysR family regulator